MNNNTTSRLICIAGLIALVLYLFITLVFHLPPASYTG